MTRGSPAFVGQCRTGAVARSSQTSPAPESAPGERRGSPGLPRTAPDGPPAVADWLNPLERVVWGGRAGSPDYPRRPVPRDEVAARGSGTRTDEPLQRPFAVARGRARGARFRRRSSPAAGRPTSLTTPSASVLCRKWLLCRRRLWYCRSGPRRAVDGELRDRYRLAADQRDELPLCAGARRRRRWRPARGLCWRAPRVGAILPWRATWVRRARLSANGGAASCRPAATGCWTRRALAHRGASGMTTLSGW